MYGPGLKYIPNSYGRSPFDTGTDWGSVFAWIFCIGFAFYLFVSGISSIGNRIDHGEAVMRFQELTGAERVEIVRHSNSSWVFGDPHDVKYELLIDGKPVSGRCESSTFSPMICRIYDWDEEGSLLTTAFIADSPSSLTSVLKVGFWMLLAFLLGRRFYLLRVKRYGVDADVMEKDLVEMTEGLERLKKIQESISDNHADPQLDQCIVTLEANIELLQQQIQSGMTALMMMKTFNAQNQMGGMLDKYQDKA